MTTKGILVQVEPQSGLSLWRRERFVLLVSLPSSCQRRMRNRRGRDEIEGKKKNSVSHDDYLYNPFTQIMMRFGCLLQKDFCCRRSLFSTPSSSRHMFFPGRFFASGVGRTDIKHRSCQRKNESDIQFLSKDRTTKKRKFSL